MADVENLVEYAVAMDKSVPPLTGMAYQLTRRFLSSQTAEMLCVAAYPEPGMKAFIRLGFARFRTITYKQPGFIIPGSELSFPTQVRLFSQLMRAE